VVTISDAVGLSTTSSVNVTVAGPAWLSTTSQATWNTATQVLTVTGAATIIADPGGAEPIVQASGTAAQITINPASGQLIHLGGLSLVDGATATVTSLGSARTATNERVIVLGIAGATVAPTFNIDSISTLDLTDNDLIDLYGSAASPYATIKGDIVQAADGGKWDKTGLTSSLAAANSSTYGLGYAEASTLGLTTFDGVTLGGNAVLVKYTLLGDANLDGTVNFNDFSIMQTHYGQAGDWSEGDFNYDGSVNFDDFSIEQNNYGQTIGVSGALASALKATTPVSTPTKTVSATHSSATAASKTAAVTKAGTSKPQSQKATIASPSATRRPATSTLTKPRALAAFTIAPQKKKH
jgi:hypothetical protein